MGIWGNRERLGGCSLLFHVCRILSNTRNFWRCPWRVQKFKIATTQVSTVLVKKAVYRLCYFARAAVKKEHCRVADTYCLRVLEAKAKVKVSAGPWLPLISAGKVLPASSSNPRCCWGHGHVARLLLCSHTCRSTLSSLGVSVLESVLLFSCRHQSCRTGPTLMPSSSLDYICKDYCFWIRSYSQLCVFWVSQSCLTLCNPMDCGLPCSSVHGIFQARILEWVAISFCRIPTQGSNPGLPHCKQTLYHLSHQKSPKY